MLQTNLAYLLRLADKLPRGERLDFYFQLGERWGYRPKYSPRPSAAPVPDETTLPKPI